MQQEQEKFRDISKAKKAHETLVASETRYRRLFESTKDGILILDAETGKIINVNPFLLELLGYPEEEILGKPIWEIGTLKDIIANQDNFLELQQKEYIRYENLPLQTLDGRQVAVEFISNVYQEDKHQIIQCNIRDITERTRSELFQNLSRDVLAIFNESGDLHDSIQRIISMMKAKTGFDAVGMRLQHGDDFPYYAQDGFSEDFLRTENSLVSRDSRGDICRNSDGCICLEGTCGLVVSGKTDPSSPLFTTGGSFWTNDSFPLLHHRNQSRRNHCIQKGYGSVALIPIRKNQQIVNLLQLNDRRKGQLSRDAISALEEIASHIGNALVRKQIEESHKKRLAELEAIYTISSTLRTAETLDEMLTLLLDEILKVLDAEAGAICLYHPTNGQLRFTTTQGWFSGLDDAFLKPRESIAGKVFASKQMLVSREYAKDSQVEYIEKIPEGWGGVCLPLQAEGVILGTLFVSVPLPREITSEELKLLTSLTEIAGTAINRIGLYEKTSIHLERIKVLRNIDMAISGSLDLRVTFRVILDEITRLLNVDSAAILRLDSHTGMLKYEAWHGFRIANPAKINLCLGEGLAGQAAMERKPIRAESPSEIVGDPVQGPLLEKEDAYSYYGVPLINKGRVKGVLEVFHREPLETNEDWLEFLETLAGQTAIAIDDAELVHDLANTNFKLIQSYDKTIKGWAHALDLRDKKTEKHSQRVIEMTITIARKMGMSHEELAHVRRGALLHDIGKMAVPDAILLKPGKLTEEEWVIMRKHTVHAFELLSPIDYLRPALDIPYCHHEKWDGSGYPRGLKGEEIPLAARIFAVADVYDALISDRPYRKAWSREEALEYIHLESGSHFDPQVVEMFFEEVKKQYEG